MKTKPRVVLVEDNPTDLVVLLREFDREGMIEVVDAFMNGSELIKRLDGSDQDFDVAVLDYNMPILNGLETFRNLHSRKRNFKLLLVSHGYYRTAMEELTAMGTQNYCRKTGERIQDAIMRLYEGRGIYDNNDPIMEWEGLTSQMALKQKDVNAWHGAFSPLERKIMTGMAIGKGSKEIASLLGYETSSIEKYRGHILRTVGLRNSQQLIAWAFANGLIEVADIMEYELSRLGMEHPGKRNAGRWLH